MDDILKVLLVEDDPLICQKYSSLAEQFEDIALVSITNNATEALQKLNDYLPNAIILDLELHNGSGSGLDVLNGIKDLYLDYIPYILVATNNTSSVTHEFARRLGADYIFSKHQKDYSEQKILEFLLLIKDAIQNKCHSASQQDYTLETPLQREQRLQHRIISELNLIGISPKAVGRQYLIDAILLTIDAPHTNLSGIIAKKYGKSDASVERAMQNAINKAWRITDIDELLQYYEARISSEKGVPTITEFVHYYAGKIRNEY